MGLVLPGEVDQTRAKALGGVRQWKNQRYIIKVTRIEDMTNNLELSESQENYMEAIFHIVAEKRAARAKDIAQRLAVKPSSVTEALSLLSEKGLINYSPYDIITLTPRGMKISKNVVRRHEVLRDFFLNVLSVDIGIADKAACSMEHALPRQILDRLTKFLNFIERNPHCLREFHKEQGT